MRSLLLLVFLAPALWAQTADEWVRRGDASEQARDAKAAAAAYQAADALRPGDGEILRKLAGQYSELMTDTKSTEEKKRLGKLALAAALAAVEVAPRNAKAHLCLAIVYGRNALLEPARRKVELSRLIRQEAETAAKLDPREDYAWHILGRWNYEIASLNPFLKAIAQTIYGEFPDASNEKAVDYFRKAIAINPRSVAHHIECGRALAAIGEKAQARQAIETGLALPSTQKDDDETKSRGRDALRGL